MTVRVLFFGLLRDMVGRSGEELTLPEGSRVQAVFDHYAEQDPRLRAMARSIMLAHNQEFDAGDAMLASGDEVALLPPVSGGSGAAPAAGELARVEEPEGHVFALTTLALDGGGLARRLQRDEDGAVVTFEGVTRNNSQGRATRHLDYECYAPMAIRVMAELGRDIVARHGIGRIGIVHRLGRVEIGEASVVIVATAPHRRAAFEAALEAIDRLKRIVPIWKKEHFTDGEVWVDGEWDDSVTTAQASLQGE